MALFIFSLFALFLFCPKSNIFQLDIDDRRVDANIMSLETVNKSNAES